jgi:hypothetical protein
MTNKKNRANIIINQAFLLGEPSKRESAKSLSPLMCGFLLPGLMSVGLTSCGLVGNKVQATRAPSVATTVTKVTPIAAKPDEVVSLTGNSFSTAKNLRVSVPLTNGDSTSVPLTISDSKTASFAMPEGAGLGVKDVKLTQGTAATEVTRFNLIADQASNQLPIIVGDGSAVCSDQKYIDRNGDEQVGTKDCAAASTKVCTDDGEVGCLTTVSYPAALATGAASKILSGQTLAGIPGTALPRPEDCSSNGATGCVTTATFKSADLTNLAAGNIKSGVTIAGIPGEYPSAEFPLAGASETADLDATNFSAQIKSAADFEYWTSSGTRQTGSGDADITVGNIKDTVNLFGVVGTYKGEAPEPWDVRVGKTVNGVAGKLKVNCRNRINSSVFNYDNPGTFAIGQSGVTSGSALDIWDTIDDFNASQNEGVPGGVVDSWNSSTDCYGVESVVGDDNVWKDVTTTNGTTASTCTATPANCTMQDKITGLSWSKSQQSTDWNTAWSNCQSLNYNGQTGWRLPTQKELMEAYTHGIRSAARTNWMTEGDMGSWFWSGSSVSFYTNGAGIVNLADGYTGNAAKADAGQVVCVR